MLLRPLRGEEEILPSSTDLFVLPHIRFGVRTNQLGRLSRSVARSRAYPAKMDQSAGVTSLGGPLLPPPRRDLYV